MATPADEIVVGACVDAGGSALGMPQLCADWMPNQIFWLIVALIVTFLILSRIALPRISSVVAERSGTITNDLAMAEDLKQRAVEAEAAYEKALADARQEANKIVADARAEIQKDLDAQLAKADARIAEQTAESEKAIAEIRDNAATSVKDVAKDTAKALIAALGGEADAKAVTAAVNSKMKG
jgi:F-type H+-transporting ATPase subunit b